MPAVSKNQSLAKRVLLSATLSVVLLSVVSLVPMFFGSWNGEIKFGVQGFRLSFEAFSEYISRGKIDRFLIGTTPRSMLKVLLRFTSVSFLLLLPTMVIAVIYGFYIPLWSRLRGIRSDAVVMAFALVPIFLLAIVLQSIALRINTGTGTHFFRLAYLGGVGVPVVLPFLTSLIPLLALVVRIVNADVSERMDLEYIWAARGKGLGEREIIIRHIGSGSLFRVEEMLPRIGGLGVTVMFVVERVYNLPGLSTLLFNVAFGREFYRFPRIPKELVQADGSVIVKMVYGGGVWVTTAQLQLVVMSAIAIAAAYGLSVLLSYLVVKMLRAKLT